MREWTFIAGVAVVAIAAAAVAVTLIFWMCGKISDDKLLRIWKKLNYLVPAAEMLFGPGTGEQKREWALDMLRRLGIKVTDEVLAMLEALVSELTHTKLQDAYDAESTKE